MRRIIRTVLLLSTCLALGAAGGAWFAHDSHASGSQNASAVAAPPALSPAPSASGAEPEDGDRVSRLVSALAIKNSLERSFRVYEAVGAVGSVDIAALLEQAKRFPREMRGALRRALFTRWMQIDPAAAGEWVRPYVSRAVGNNSIGGNPDLPEIWCQAAPEAALKEAARHPFRHASGSLASLATLTLAGGNHAAALDRIAAITEPRLRENAIGATLCNWAEDDPARAFAAFSRLHDPQERETTAQAILPKWAATDPAAALRAMDEILPSLSSEQAGNIAHNLAEAAGKAAAAWAVAQTGDLRFKAADAVFSGWMTKEPLAAIEWAVRENLFEHPSFANGSFLMHSADSSNPALRDTLLALPDSPGRTRVIAWLMGAMTKTDARNTLLALPESARDDAAMAFVGRQMNSLTPENAPTLLQELPSGAARTGGVKSMAMGFAVRFPNQIDDFLSSLADDAERDAAASAAVVNLQRNREQAIAVASRITDPQLRDRARAEIFRSWLWRDAGAAHAWLDQSGLSMEWKEVLRAEARER